MIECSRMDLLRSAGTGWKQATNVERLASKMCKTEPAAWNCKVGDDGGGTGKAPSLRFLGHKEASVAFQIAPRPNLEHTLKEAGV